MLHGLSALVLGLGLFFLGVQLAGDNLRRLSGRSFRKVIQEAGDSVAVGSLAGLGFGALMQSATAVTFVLASMQRSGLVTSVKAMPVILWSNVGLTALAFLATLDIHPLVAYFVGAAGIFSGTVRNPNWRAYAGVLLGVGLILYGLESMGTGAEPLRNEAWFRGLLDQAVGSPVIAFAVGIAAAALLQSNTGATMLVITLAGAGAFDVERAALLIYGTNLGAIPLRIVLGMNLDRPSQRLVRYEDLFCLCSGVVMTLLTFVPWSGMPLIPAIATRIAPGVELQLAAVFLLSNLIPAAGMALAIRPAAALLQRLLPGESSAALAQPKFLSDSALSDPSSAIDLMAKEEARLLEAIRVEPRRPDGDPEERTDPAFLQLGNVIESFGARLVSRSRLTEKEAHSVHLLRAELSLIRYVESAVSEFNEALWEAGKAGGNESAISVLSNAMRELTQNAQAAANHLDPAAIEKLRSATKRRGDFVKQQTGKATTDGQEGNATASPEAGALADAFELAAWMLHRLSKVLTSLAELGG